MPVLTEAEPRIVAEIVTELARSRGAAFDKTAKGVEFARAALIDPAFKARLMEVHRRLDVWRVESGMARRLCGLLLLVFFALMGCETEPWVKPGATTSQLRRDLADCERVATGPTPFHFWALGLSYERARDRIVERKAECMKGRGWAPAVARRDLPLVPPCGEAAGVLCDGQAGRAKEAL